MTENNLIKVDVNKHGEQVVSGKRLHKFLGIKTRYDIWFDRMCEYGFEKDVDYIAIVQKRTTAQGNVTTYTNHVLTLDMAKEICMIQRSDIGKQARRYFIQVEKAYKEYAVARALSKEVRRSLTDVIRDDYPESTDKKYVYKNITDLAYKDTFGANAKQLRDRLGITKKDNLRDCFSENELKVLQEKEDLIKSLVKSGYKYQQIKDILSMKYIDGDKPCSA